MSSVLLEEKRSKTLFFTSVLISILLGFNTITAYYSIQKITENKLNSEWKYIESVLIENQDKSDIQTSYIKENVINDVNTTYGKNQSRLNYDLDNLDVNNDLLKIFDKDMNGKFINKNNDNNDLFVLSTWQKNSNIDLDGKVIYDKSINCMSKGPLRTFDEELAMHYNYNLGYDGIKRMLEQNKEKPIFWEYLKSTNPNHIKLDYCSIEGLKEVYKAEGIEGLKTYEILNPVYIMDDMDLLGNMKVNNAGLYNKENRQIIIVQGFSLYDALKSTIHQTNLLSLEKDYELQFEMAIVMDIFGIILTIVVIFSLSKFQNVSSELEELRIMNNKK